KSEIVTLKTVDGTGAITWDETVGDLDRFKDGFTVTSTDFDLTVGATRGPDLATVETWTGLTLERAAPNYVVTVLNDLARGSKWLVAKDERATSQTKAALVPATPTEAPLALA